MSSSNKYIDEYELLSRLKDGDKEAFDAIYHRYSFRIYRKLLRMAKLELIAEELTQEVFVKVWEKRHLINLSQSFRSYLFQIAQNFLIDFYRKAARDQKLNMAILSVATDASDDTESTILYRESQHLLKTAVSQLPAQQQLVFQLCKLEGRSYEETADLMGISIATVSNHMTKASRAVREFLSRQHNIAVIALLSSILRQI